jgi:hypothetical protein
MWRNSVMLEVNTPKELRKLANTLSKRMKCGSREEILLHSVHLIEEAPKLFMAVNLSIIDARECKDGIIMTIENRFGEQCLSGNSHHL